MRRYRYRNGFTEREFFGRVGSNMKLSTVVIASVFSKNFFKNQANLYRVESSSR